MNQDPESLNHLYRWPREACRQREDIDDVDDGHSTSVSSSERVPYDISNSVWKNLTDQERYCSEERFQANNILYM